MVIKKLLFLSGMMPFGFSFLYAMEKHQFVPNDAYKNAIPLVSLQRIHETPSESLQELDTIAQRQEKLKHQVNLYKSAKQQRNHLLEKADKAEERMKEAREKCHKLEAEIEFLTKQKNIFLASLVENMRIHNAVSFQQQSLQVGLDTLLTRDVSKAPEDTFSRKRHHVELETANEIRAKAVETIVLTEEESSEPVVKKMKVSGQDFVPQSQKESVSQTNKELIQLPHLGQTLLPSLPLNAPLPPMPSASKNSFPIPQTGASQIAYPRLQFLNNYKMGRACNQKRAESYDQEYYRKLALKIASGERTKDIMQDLGIASKSTFSRHKKNLIKWGILDQNPHKK